MGREDPDEANVLWREAAYQSSIRQCPVAALADERGRPMWFAADEVLIGERDLALVEDFEALGAEVLPEPELPQPERMRGLRPINDAVAPRTIRMRFTRPLSEEAITQGVAAFDEAQGDTGISQASSRNAAALAGQVLRLGSGGRRQVGLNIFGEGETLPLATITEGQLNSGIIPGGNNPLAWATHDRPFRIADAWQLLESYRLRRPLGKVFVGIMDGGFWVDGNGNPLGPDSDLPPNVSRLNLMDPGAPIDGPNRATCGGNRCDWHGNAVASIAVGRVDNRRGAAGSGGTVAEPVLLRTRVSAYETGLGVSACVRWGVDVLNMSFTIRPSNEIYFYWIGFGEMFDQNFEFATEQGLVMVASAGNDWTRIPEDGNHRPATRTRGVITVGALQPVVPGMPAQATVGDNTGSNFGSSVAIWAPGTAVPAESDPTSGGLGGTAPSGTSAAAPLVAGVAAMMRAIDPTLNYDRTLRILRDTGWEGAPPVDRGLDAYAAVLVAMGGVLPADLQEAAQPVPLVADGGAPGRFVLPEGWAVLSGREDRVDRWRIDAEVYSQIVVRLDWYGRLGRVRLVLDVLEGGDGRVDKLTQVELSGSVDLTAELGAGSYEIRVIGADPTAYELTAELRPLPIVADPFEPNDTIATATRLGWQPEWLLAFTPRPVRVLGLGGHELTLHRHRIVPVGGLPQMDIDVYSFRAPEGQPEKRPRLFLRSHEHPIDAELLDAAGVVVRSWPGERSIEINPAGNQEMFLRVSGARPTRYTLVVTFLAEAGDFPGYETIPEWWHGPIDLPGPGPRPEWVVDLTSETVRRDGLAFEVAAGGEIGLELVNKDGRVVKVFERVAAGDAPLRLSLATADLEPGSYLVRSTEDAVGNGANLTLRLAKPTLEGG